MRARPVQRLVLAGRDAFSDRAPKRRGPFFAARTHELRAVGVTTRVRVELPALFGPSVAIPLARVAAIVENILFLRYVELRSQL